MKKILLSILTIITICFSSDIDTYIVKGMEAQMNGNVVDAIFNFKKAQSIDSENSWANRQLGYLYITNNSILNYMGLIQPS